MAKSVLTIIVLLLSCSMSYGQFMNFNNTADSDSHDISKLIYTSYDFDQTNLSVDSIDKKIEQIIIAQNDKTLYDLEVPVNLKKIRYIGFVHPVETELFLKNQEYFEKNDSELKIKTNIYKYENIYIATETNTPLDMYLVYSTIRAFLIIKYRYTYIHEKLFFNASTFPENFLSIKNATEAYINTNYFVTFDRKIKEPPASLQRFGPATKYQYKNASVDVYNNVQVVYMNKKTIKKGGTISMLPIYSGTLNENERIEHYMRDGFINTLVHEQIHCFISTYEDLNDFCQFLRKGCVEQGYVQNWYALEEIIVTNTANILFNMLPDNGGLSKDIKHNFDKVYADLLSSLNSKSYDNIFNSLVPYYNVNSLKEFASSDIFNHDINNQIFFLNFSYPRNVPTGKTTPTIPNNDVPLRRNITYKNYVNGIK